MAKKPRKKRTRGNEPPLGLNSLKARLEAKDPRTKARISGRMYCTRQLTVKPQGAGDIPLKAGNTDAHVGRISELLEEGCNDAYEDTT